MSNKIPLDIYKEEPERSLLFWYAKYLRHKVSTLSKNKVNDQQKLASAITLLRKQVSTISELQHLVKEINSAGFNSIYTYFSPLKKLYEHIKTLGIASLREINDEIAQDFITSYAESMSNSTQRNYKTSLVNFFSYVDKHNEIGEDLSYSFGITLSDKADLKGNKGKKLPEYLNEEEIKMLIKGLYTYPFKSEQSQALAIISIKLLLFSGARISEISNLKKDEIKLGTGCDKGFYMLKLVGKGGKERLVPIAENLIGNDIKRWSEYSIVSAPYFLHSRKGVAISRIYLRNTLKSILSHLGIKKSKYGPHLLRHSAGSLVYKKQKDMLLVKELLGHESTRTTEIYTHMDAESMKKISSSFS